MRRLGLVLLAAAGLLVLSGCGTAMDPIHLGRFQDAREQVLNLVQRISDDRTGDINGFARAAVAKNTSVDLIGTESREATSREDVLGTLTFWVSYHEQYKPDDNYCFAADFSWYGFVGFIDHSNNLKTVGCPPDPQALVPLPDTSIHFASAENANEVALAVLTAQGVKPNADDIAQQITAQLIAPSGEYQRVAPPQVLVDGENIGVSMGGPKDCVLVARVDGAVYDLHPPKVLLQEGEYGCRPETALTDPDQLRPPH